MDLASGSSLQGRLISRGSMKEFIKEAPRFNSDVRDPFQRKSLKLFREIL